MLKRILLGVLIVLIVVQFIQPPKNYGPAFTSNDIGHVVPVSDTVMALLKVACYDCHSDSTRYPWYNHITPVNWWLYNHVTEGKHHLNFSQFSKGSFKRKMRGMEETSKQTKEHEMPIGSYLWIHKDARLNDAQRKLITDWADSARQQLMRDSLRKASIQ